MQRLLFRTALVVLLMGIAFQGMAQSVQPLTLQEAVQRAETQSKMLRVADLEHRISQAQYRQTDAVLLPQVTLSYTGMLTNHPLNAFGFLLQQQGVSMASFNPAALNHPDATANFGTALDVKLPLFNLDLHYARKAARTMTEVNRHKAQYVRSHLRYETQKAYAQLQFAHRAKQVLEATLKDVESIRQTVVNFEAQGLVQHSDVLNANVQVNTVEAALAKAQSNVASASEGLALLMGMERSEGLVFEPDSLARIEGNLATEFSPDRADVQAMRAGVQATQLMERSAFSAFVPKLNLFGSYQLNNDKPLTFRHGAYLVGVNLSWPIFQGNQARYKARAAQLTTEKMRDELQLHLDRSQVEAHKVRRDIMDHEVECRKHQTSVAQAEEALRIVRHRHGEGLASTTDLLQAQAQLSQQRLALAQSMMHRNIAIYQYELLTHSND